MTIVVLTRTLFMLPSTFPQTVLGIFGNYLPLFTDYEGYFAQRADYGQAYIDAVQKLMPLWMEPVLLIACFVCGIIGGLLGRALLKKHFEKAGLV